MRQLRIVFLLVFIAVSACTSSVKIDGFDAELWKADQQGCQGSRAELVAKLMDGKSALLGLYQKKIIQVLGQPEEQELYERSQTYYRYFIDPAESCAGENSEEPRMLEIRFTALGIANEVNIR